MDLHMNMLLCIRILSKCEYISILTLIGTVYGICTVVHAEACVSNKNILL
jgi:nicotinamide riboside transporter PnuC